MKKNNNDSYYCGQLIINPELGQINTPSESIRLGPVNMRVLVALIEKQGQLVSRAELFDSVWKNQVVSDDVLTRCISDLRALFGKQADFEQWIQTVPKKGYRWLPEVSNEVKNEIIANSAPQKKGRSIPAKKWQHYLGVLTAGIASLLIISTSSLWLVEQWLKTDLTRVALIPIQVELNSQSLIASELDDLLTSKLLATEGIRFLARSAVESRPDNHFSYLTREFGTQWIIEGRVRAYQNKYRVSLSLVDARTATVYYSLTSDVEKDLGLLDPYCDKFILNVTRHLNLE